MEKLDIEQLERESQMVTVDNFEDFTKHNIGDVKRIIFSRYSNAITPNMNLDEITQDVLYHLLRNNSIGKFDKSRGVKFSTYIYSCIHYYIISFHLRKTNKTHTEKNCIESLDEVFPGGSKISDYLGSYEEDIDSTIDLERVRCIVEKLDSQKRIRKFRSKVSYTDVFDMLILGYRERDIAKKHKVTQTCVSLKRKEIIEVARKELGLKEEAPFFN